MKEQVVLVDFENVQKLELAQRPGHARSGLEGNGPNALDFHIACHLGEGLARTPQAEFVIVSRDTGFDPLLRHLKARGLQCRREAPAAAAKAAPKPVLDANAQQVVEVLKRTEKNKRPRKRETLSNRLLKSAFRTRDFAFSLRTGNDQSITCDDQDDEISIAKSIFNSLLTISTRTSRRSYRAHRCHSRSIGSSVPGCWQGPRRRWFISFESAACPRAADLRLLSTVHP